MSPLIAMQLLVFVLFFVVVVCTLLVYSAMFWSIFRDAPYVPSPRKVTEAMMDLAEVKKGELVIDLGSGHGPILFAAVRRGARARGYELSRLLVWTTRFIRKVRLPRADLVVRQSDFMGADLTDADVVICYLFPKAMAGLKPKFEGILRPGTRVVSASFRIPDWTPERVIHIANRPIFLYYPPRCPQRSMGASSKPDKD
jgi:SAM-dependent methyltransferase